MGLRALAAIALALGAITLLGAPSAASAETYQEAVEGTSGVVHFWPMGEASGASLADVVGGADAETSGGVTLGEPGGLAEGSATSALFNGSSGAAQASVNLSGTHELTVEFWMKWSTYGADDHLALEFTPNFNDYPGGLLIDPDATPGSDFAVSVGKEYSANTVFFARPSAGEWHYYAFVINTEAPAETEITPYVDGHTVSYTKSASGTGAGNFADSTLFWMSRDASTLFGAGNMQDLALYDTTLSAGTILEHYDLGVGGPKAAFGSTPVKATAGVPVRFDGSGSSSPAGSIVDYAWDFDGGKGYGTDSGESPTVSHTFSSAGTYTVDLRVKDGTGATATVSHTVTVGAALPAYEQAVEKTAGLAHFWPMGEASGSVFADVFGGAGATAQGGVTLGEPGGLVDNSATAALFDGSSGAAQANVNLSGTHKLTVEFWMQWSTYGSDDHLALEFTPNFNEHNGGFLVDPDATPGSDFAASLGRGGSVNTVFFERPSAGAWHYYTFVLNTEAPGETEITPYVDGHAVSYTKSESGTGAGSFADSTLFWMSRDADTLFGAGDMQDLALYETTLGAGTILEHYERGENTYVVANTTAPSIEGSPRDGETLSADPGSWSGASPISYVYQWQSCNVKGEECEEIPGATASSYTVSSGDLETSLRVLVTATNPGGSARATSAASAEVKQGAPSELRAPSVSGTPDAGETLYADPGEWGGTETEIAYQWEKCNATGGECADIAGATESQYQLPEGDAGATLRVRVGASNALGSLTAVSPATEAIGAAAILQNTWAPSISGTPQRGRTLTANAGSWLGAAAIGYTYQWERCDRYGYGCENIVGATESTYVPGAEDVGSALRVLVSASETGGTAAAVSPVTLPIAAEGGPVIEESPAISGVGLVGDTLTATGGAWAGEAPFSYSYQWERCEEGGEGCSAISGATSGSYTLTESDAGSAVRVFMTAADEGGSTAAASPGVDVSAATLVKVSAPSISGETQLGRTLAAGPGIWTGAEAIAYAYQWQRCNEKGESCADITGATEATYTTVAADLGDTLKVTVSVSGTAGSGSASSGPTPLVTSEPMAPESTSPPSIEGNPTTGTTLSAEPGLWLGSEPIAYTYQWQRCNAEGGECANIHEATGETYMLGEADLKSTIQVIVTAKNSLGSTSAISEPSEEVEAPGPPASSEGPTIIGTAKEGERVFADNGVWSGSRPLSYTYRWERCNTAGESCASIEGATKPSYTVAGADVGSSLRVKVTVSNSEGATSALSPPAVAVSASEASVKEAIEIAEATDPSVLAASTSASLEEQAVKPAISDTGIELTAGATLNGSTISKETPGEFAVNSPDGEFSITPVGTAANATTTPTIVNGAAAVFAGTSAHTDTIVRPSALGATTLLQLRSTEAPSSYTWEVGLGAGQQLEELPNGSIAVVEPESGSVLSGSLPEEPLGKPETTSAEPGGEGGVDGKAAEEELESSGEESGSSEPPAAPLATTSEVTPKSGELHPQETESQYESDTGYLADAKEDTANKVLMVIAPPKVMDAEGESVPATLSAAGNTFTMTLSLTGKTPPLTAATPIIGPISTGGTPAFEVRYGLSDPKATSFDEAEEEPGKLEKHFDTHLESGPLHVKIARDVVPYKPNAKELEELIAWLKAVNQQHLEPYVTFGVLENTFCKKEGKKVWCPKGDDPSTAKYGEGIKEVIEKIKKSRKEEAKEHEIHKESIPDSIPEVKIWGAWNEPDLDTGKSYDPLYKHAERAALFWKEGRAVLKELGCNCTMVAGEFAEDKDHSYISKYKHVILHDHHLWPRKPNVWGLHDYHDLVEVSKAHPDRIEDASSFAKEMRRGMGHPRIWLSEQGVDLNNGGGETELATSSNATERQRLAAHDFLHLHTASELYIELVDYYLYKAPSKEEMEEHHEKHSEVFDSALLNGNGQAVEAQNPREAYCVLALGEQGCPTATTKSPVPGTTTPTASTVLVDVDPEGLPTDYFLEYGLTTSYGHTTTSTALANDTGAQSETVALTSLEPCTTYHYQVEAEDLGDEGAPSLGGDQTLTTGCGPTVTTGSALFLGDWMYELSGTINPNGEASTYEFEYGPTKTYGYTTSPGEAGSGTSPVDVDAEVEVEPIAFGGEKAEREREEEGAEKEEEKEEAEGDFELGGFHPDLLICGKSWHFRLVGKSGGLATYGKDNKIQRCI